MKIAVFNVKSIIASDRIPGAVMGLNRRIGSKTSDEASSSVSKGVVDLLLGELAVGPGIYIQIGRLKPKCHGRENWKKNRFNR